MALSETVYVEITCDGCAAVERYPGVSDADRAGWMRVSVRSQDPYRNMTLDLCPACRDEWLSYLDRHTATRRARRCET